MTTQTQLTAIKISVKDAFGINSGMMVPGFTGEHPLIPSATDGYVFNTDVLRDVLSFTMNPDGVLYLTGPHGSGKSSAVTEVSARLNWPTVKITGHDELTFSDMCGQWIMGKDGMKFAHGPLAQAMKYGYFFVIDEIDAIPATELMGLHPVADGEPLTIPENEGEVIMPHPNFRLFFTGNTAGAGDDTGLYQGTKRLNAAFMDRCSVTRVDYMKEEAEIAILRNLCNSKIPDTILASMVKTANKIRTQHMEHRLSVSMSTRSLKRWLRMCLNFASRTDKFKYCMDRCVTNKAPEAEAIAINEIGKAIFGDDWDKCNV